MTNATVFTLTCQEARERAIQVKTQRANQDDFQRTNTQITEAMNTGKLSTNVCITPTNYRQIKRELEQNGFNTQIKQHKTELIQLSISWA